VKIDDYFLGVVVVAAFAFLVALAVVGAFSLDAKTGPPTRHQAKVATFGALLRETEQQPDVVDQTRADITVSACARVSGGWRCRGTLNPVTISGIDTTCRYTVRVGSRTKITHRSC